MPTDLSPNSPIGVFDSGIGGLTVAASLRRLLPNENILYIGDTARVPYGGKSRETVERYSIEIGNMLLNGGAKMIVVACNTASALGVPRMKQVFEVPVVGVVLPGANAAVDSTKNKTIGVIGTRATIASGAYEEAILKLEPAAKIHSTACPLLVPLIEEGLFEDSITDQMLRRYLEPLLSKGIDTLVLGCTHFSTTPDSPPKNPPPPNSKSPSPIPLKASSAPPPKPSTSPSAKSPCNRQCRSGVPHDIERPTRRRDARATWLDENPRLPIQRREVVFVRCGVDMPDRVLAVPQGSAEIRE
jgi:glutamate racemase